jgi:hypothetical protein
VGKGVGVLPIAIGQICILTPDQTAEYRECILVIPTAANDPQRERLHQFKIIILRCGRDFSRSSSSGFHGRSFQAFLSYSAWVSTSRMIAVAPGKSNTVMSR